MLLHNFFGHLSTVTRHRHMVMVHCFKAGIIKRGLLHDLSKFSPTEFIPGVLYYQGSRSPNEKEREVTGYSRAWMHHKGRNTHHFEYWTDYSTVTGTLDPMKMPDIYIFEMFCDRVRPKRAIEQSTADKLEFLLRLLADKGEDAAFRYIRKRVRKLKNEKHKTK